MFLRSVAGRKPLCSEQTTEEDAVKISIRDVGNGEVVEVEGRRSGTSPDLRRTFSRTSLAPQTGSEPGGHPVHRSSGIATLIEVLKDSRVEQRHCPVRDESRGSRSFRLTHVIRIFQVFRLNRSLRDSVMQWVARSAR